MSIDLENPDPKKDPDSGWNHATVGDKPYDFIHEETYRSRRNLIVMSSLMIAIWWLELSPAHLQGFLINLSDTPEQKFFILLWMIALYEALSFGLRLWNDYTVWHDATIFITHNTPTMDRTDANKEFTISEHLRKAAEFEIKSGDRYLNAVYKGLMAYIDKKMILTKQQKFHLIFWEIGIPYLLFITATMIVFRNQVASAYCFFTA